MFKTARPPNLPTRTPQWAAALIGRLLMMLVVGSGSSVSAASDAGLLEEIVVTGSHIARSDFISASPIVTIPGSALQTAASVSVEQTLNRYPQFVPAVTATSNTPGNDGQANLSLRGLGISQTLVLLDGRRLVSADGRGSIDLNVIPPGLIESVEIVTGGASATYGSDAVAGAVNLRLLENFEGVRIDGQWGETTHGDGAEYSGGLTAGFRFADGRGSFVGYAGHANREQVDQGDREATRYPLNYFADDRVFLPGGSGITEEGASIVFAGASTFNAVFADYGYPPGSVPYQAGFGVNPDRTVFTIGNDTPGSVANFRGSQSTGNDRAHTYNFAPLTALRLPLERDSLFLRSTFEFSPAAELYLLGLYGDYTVTRQLPPVDAGILLIPPTNPYVPPDLQRLLDSRANPGAPFRYFKRMTELGPRASRNDRELLQGTLGIEGALSDRWDYDAYVQWGRNTRSEEQSGLIQISKFEDLSFATDGGESTCGGLDPFGKGNISAECARYITVSASNEAVVEQKIVEATVTGSVAVLPARELQLAFGVFHKQDSYDYVADPLLRTFIPAIPGVIGARPDVVGLGSTTDRGGEEQNTDVYVEALLPLIPDTQPGQSLDLGVGYRLSEYEQAGNADSYKAELLYSPRKEVRLRGSFQHAVRAPSVDELYSPQVSGQFVVPIPDPCSVSSSQRQGADAAQVEALCLAQGVPASVLPTYNFVLRRVDGYSGGNPDLRSEQADTYSFGVVWTPTVDAAQIENLQVALDWYRIDLDRAVGRWTLEPAVNRCFDPRYNPRYEASNVYCSFFTRVPTTGEMFGTLIDRNIGGRDTAGVDLQVDAAFALNPGPLLLQAYLNYVSSWKIQEPDGREVDYAGTLNSGLGSAIPRLRALVHATQQWGDASIGMRWEHIGPMEDAIYRDFEVSSRNYVHFEAAYSFDDGIFESLTVRAGLENAFGEDAPLYPSWQQANTDPALYDVIGRRYVLGVQYDF